MILLTSRTLTDAVTHRAGGDALQRGLLMAAVQVRDILNAISRFYQRLSRLFASAQKHARGERLPYVLEYIVAREKQLATSLEQFKETANPGLLDTWLQFGAEETLTEMLAQIDIPANMAEDDIVGEVLKIDAKLITLYEALAKKTSVLHVRELFESLANVQEARERQLAFAMR